GVSPYTSSCDFARTCVFSKQSLLPGLCGPQTLPPQGVFTPQAPLLPKLRGHFAEFLNHDSLDRLSILYLTTCVGLGYGQLGPHAEVFLGSIGSPNPLKSHQLSDTQGADLPTPRPTVLDPDNHRRAGLPSCVTPVIALIYYQIGSCHPSNPSEDIMNFQHLASSGSIWAVLRIGTGISTRYPSTTPVGLVLCPDRPRADEPAPGTPRHSAGEVLSRHSLLMPAFSLVWHPRLGHPAASHPTRRSPTHPRTWTTHECAARSIRKCHSFGGVLEPR